MIQALYFSHLSISCLGDKQENLKKCITGIAHSSGEDPCQECGWMRMCKISWQISPDSIRSKTTECTNTNILLMSTFIRHLEIIRTLVQNMITISKNNTIHSSPTHYSKFLMFSVCVQQNCLLLVTITVQQSPPQPAGPCTQPDMHTTPWGSSLSAVIINCGTASTQ